MSEINRCFRPSFQPAGELRCGERNLKSQHASVVVVVLDRSCQVKIEIQLESNLDFVLRVHVVVDGATKRWVSLKLAKSGIEKLN